MKYACRAAVFKIISGILAVALLSHPGLIPRTYISASSSLSLILQKTNSWEEAGKIRSQFSAEIKNEGTEAVSGWIITIAVPEGSSMSAADGWNGVYAISGTHLTITPKEYNKQIAAGSGTSDIGFILTTAAEVELTGSVDASSAGSPSNTSSPVSGTSAGSSQQGTAGLSADPSLAPTQDDWLHTDGNKILDKNGTEVWLTGINWFGYNTGTNVFDGVWACNMEAALAAIADRGFNLLRIPISAELVLNWKNGVYPPANYNQASNPELAGLDSLAIFDLAIAQCKANGIKVMLDIHSANTDSMGHMTNLWYTDSISTQDYYDSLVFLAERFTNDDTVIAYDLKNEPHGKPGEAGAIWNDSTAVNNWKNTAETAGNLVLDINPQALIMIEGIEIYPKDIKTNADYSSTDPAEYFFSWWGGNLRGVRDYPIDFGSEARNAQIVYSPHDYGPAVYAQPWFQDGFTYESLQEDCWNDNWLYISKDNISPLLIGEWGGYMTEPNLAWMTDLRKLILENHLNHTFWCFNANSGDTGGLVKDDFTTWDEEKYAFVKEVLWQEDGKFVGLDHVIPLGKSGTGISLSAISGEVDASENIDGTVPADNAAPSPIPAQESVQSTGDSGSSNQASSSAAGISDTLTDNKDSIWSPLNAAFAGLAMLAVLAGSVVLAYVTYTKNKKKGEDK